MCGVPTVDTVVGKDDGVVEAVNSQRERESESERKMKRCLLAWLHVCMISSAHSSNSQLETGTTYAWKVDNGTDGSSATGPGRGTVPCYTTHHLLCVEVLNVKLSSR